MRVLLLIFAGIFCSFSPAYGQDNVIMPADSLIVNLSDFDSDTSGISLLQFDTWRFNPGHDSAWAHPEYDDVDWYSLKPSSDSILAVTDSLWHGHGWWRLTFKVDSSFYETPRIINFETFGAAEIYLDGKKVDSYGSPSQRSEEEVLPSIIPVMHPPFHLKPAQKHVLAFRYSFHQYEHLRKFSYSGNLNKGVSIWIYSTDHNISHYKSLFKEALPVLISLVVVFMIMLLHLIFYIKFPKEKANLWIFLLSLHLLFLGILMILNNLLDFRGYYLIAEYLISYSFFQFCGMIPLVLSAILKTNQYKLWKYLAGGGIGIAGLHYLLLNIENPLVQILANLLPILAAALVLVAGFFIIWDAIKLKRQNIWIISTGLLSLPVMILVGIIGAIVAFINTTGPPEWIDLFITIILTVSFLALPLCMSIYMGKMFFDLYGDLESSVRTRTRELNEKNKKLESANQEIQEQRDEVIKARDNLQKALTDLQAAQTQLVQQEKLASLGQLTAGIAHEIKNPLNFVNNFSDLSIELIEEAREELSAVSSQLSAKGEREKVEEALEILNDIETNLRKIHEHGSRADSIVKSMLQHSRGGSGKMEPTNLNALVKEYVNLSFHGMRAGKNPINVDMQFDLDESIGKVPLIAEDFSRVIINLCNNGFDAMREKLSAVSDQPSASYKPKLTVRTKTEDGKVVVEIEDNGPGIPEEMKDKILQPFFTTKKGTEGTGLGLSITHDIVKAHGGELKIEPVKNGTCMNISLIQK